MKKMITASAVDSNVLDMHNKLKKAVWHDVFDEYCYEHDIDSSWEPSPFIEEEKQSSRLEADVYRTISDLATQLTDYANRFPKI